MKIPYILIHDADPINFPENKESKTDKEKSALRMFKENDKIVNTLEPDIGKIVKINPELENVIGVTTSQAEKHGKVRATYFKYDEMNPDEYPEKVKVLMKLLVEWTSQEKIYELTA